MRIVNWDCRIIPQSNSPMPVLPTMQSDDVRQENMATVLNIPLKCFKRKRFIHSAIAELQVPMAVYFLYRNSTNDDLWYISVSWIDLATSSTVTAHEWSSFTITINTCLSLHLRETAEIVRNSVTKDAFFYVPTHQDFQHLLQFNVHLQTYQFKAL